MAMVVSIICALVMNCLTDTACSFYINLPIGGAAALFLVLVMRIPSHAQPVQAPMWEKIQQMDLIGVFSITGSMVCYLYALQSGGVALAWSDSKVIGTFIGCILLLGVFVANEYFQQKHAVMLGKYLRNYDIFGACVFSFV